MTGVFDAGTYTVLADARERDSSGRYTLLLDTAPLAGSGVRGDGCGDAAPLGALSSGGTGAVAGDTFAARDDVAGTCGGAGAPDVVYRVEVPRRSRFVASLDGEEAPHILVVWRRCAERAAEVACGRAVDEVLAPGTYYVAVDGASAEAFGRFTPRLGAPRPDGAERGVRWRADPPGRQGVERDARWARPTSSSRRAGSRMPPRADRTASSRSCCRRARPCASTSRRRASTPSSPCARRAPMDPGAWVTSSSDANRTPTPRTGRRSNDPSRRGPTGSSSTGSLRTIGVRSRVEYRVLH